jgi:hypothetical protein
MKDDGWLEMACCAAFIVLAVFLFNGDPSVFEVMRLAVVRWLS